MDTTQSVVEKSAIKKVAYRLVPFVALMFFINYLDRTAIAFAGPNGMNADLGLSAAQFGFASGVFFIGYILLEVPSNLALHKFGARRWLSRIMVSWGIVSLLFTWVSSVEGLYILRFILGVAEAGFFPGAILFLSLWVPSRHRSKILALFYLAQPLTTVIGAPLAGWLIQQEGLFGLEGWRVMYLGVSIPAIVVGIIAWFYLADSPAKAKWLNQDEKTWLTNALETEKKETAATHKHVSVRTVFSNGKVWTLSAIYFGFIYGLYALAFFLPTIIAGFESLYGSKFDVLQKGLITAIPYVFAALALYFWSKDATKRGVKTWHIALPALIGGLSIPRGPVRRLAGRHHRRHHRHGHGHLRRTAQLLDCSHPVPHRSRSRSRHRPDQHRGQPGRLQRRLRYRLAQRLERRLHRTDVRRRRLYAPLRRPHGGAEPLRQGQRRRPR